MHTCKPVALGVGLGVSWGLYVLFIGITSMYGWGTDIVTVLSSLYIGYSATIGGAVLGGIWGFFDGFIGGVIIAWVYNRVAR